MLHFVAVPYYIVPICILLKAILDLFGFLNNIHANRLFNVNSTSTKKIAVFWKNILKKDFVLFLLERRGTKDILISSVIGPPHLVPALAAALTPAGRPAEPSWPPASADDL